MFANAGSPIFTGIILAAALEVQYPDYVAKEYQVFLMSLACAIVGVVLNIWLFDYYPIVTRFMIVFINLSTVYILVALLVRANPKASAHTVFVKVINETGWDSDALVFLLCFLPGCVAIACFDAGAHMSEEMDSPERQVPLVMVGASALCACTAIPMVLVYLFCSVNTENLLTPAGGQPIFQLFIDGFDSKALLTVALIIYVLVYLGSCPATLATGSRLVWSFAKHGGLPFPEWIGYVDPKSQIPVNAVYLTTVVGTLISLLLFGPSTILNGIFGAAAVCFLFSYGLPIWLNVATWGRQLPPTRYFNLGRFSMVLSIVAIVWQFVSVTFLCFPTYRPVTTTNMNWASVCAVVGFFIFGLNWVFYSRKHYHTPSALFVEGLHGPSRH
jgi:choline transport protein